MSLRSAANWRHDNAAMRPSKSVPSKLRQRKSGTRLPPYVESPPAILSTRPASWSRSAASFACLVDCEAARCTGDECQWDRLEEEESTRKDKVGEEESHPRDDSARESERSEKPNQRFREEAR